MDRATLGGAICLTETGDLAAPTSPGPMAPEALMLVTRCLQPKAGTSQELLDQWTRPCRWVKCAVPAKDGTSKATAPVDRLGNGVHCARAGAMGQTALVRTEPRPGSREGGAVLTPGAGRGEVEGGLVPAPAGWGGRSTAARDLAAAALLARLASPMAALGMRLLIGVFFFGGGE